MILKLKIKALFVWELSRFANLCEREFWYERVMRVLELDSEEIGDNGRKIMVSEL